MAGATPEKIDYLKSLIGLDLGHLVASPPADADEPARRDAPQGTPINLDLNSPANQAAIMKTVTDANEADAWIKQYLATNKLGPDINGDGSGATVMFGDKTTKLDKVTDTIVAAGRLASLPSGGNAADVITKDRVARQVAAHLVAQIPRAPGANPSKPGGGVPSVSMQLGYSFIPQTTHDTASGGHSVDQPAHQIAGTLNVAFHADDKDGFEIGATAAITIFADDKDKPEIPQSAFAGIQLAWVKSFLEGALTAGPLLSAVGGAARAQQTLTGKLEWAPTGQVGIGGQVQYAIPGFNGHVLVGAQAGVSATMSRGAESTIDQSAALTFTYKF